MPHDQPPLAPFAEAPVRPIAEPGAAGLPGLVQRTCQALQAMAASLEALDSVLLRIEDLAPRAEAHAGLIADTRETVAHVIALLQREGPPLLFRAQALRLRLRLQGYAAGRSGAAAMRALHVELDGLAGFRPERVTETASYWAGCIRRLRTDTMILLAEFEGQLRRLARQPEQDVTPPPVEPAMAALSLAP